MNNCRFQVFINGDDVTLTLRPGQTLEHYQGGPTDEGWSSVWHSWTLSDDGRELTREYVSDGCDCDGRLTSGGIDYADANPATFTRGYDPYKDRPQRWPYWLEESHSRRDYQAEAAGF